MRLIPSISPEASVSGQGKQGRTPSGAHQCCSASSASRAAGEAALSTGDLQVAAVSRTYCCGYSAGNPWQDSRFLLPPVLRVTVTGHISKWLVSVSKDAVQACFFSKCELPPQRCPQGCFQMLIHFLADDLLHWQQSFLLFGNELKMAGKFEGACSSSCVNAGVVSFTEARTWPCTGHVSSVLPSPLVGWLVIAA